MPAQASKVSGNPTQAAFDAAQHQLAQADNNLQRTQVRSPVNGYVTNLLMRVGDYAHAGVTSISVIDADSYRIDGYFEGTKMAHICGDRAAAAVMGYRDPIVGRVQTVTRGISVPLISGMTATVTIRDAEAQEGGGWRQRFASLTNRLGDIAGAAAVTRRIPRIGDEKGATVILPMPKPITPPNPRGTQPGPRPRHQQAP